MRLPLVHMPVGKRAAYGIGAMTLLVFGMAVALFVQAGMSERLEQSIEYAAKFGRTASELRVAWVELVASVNHMLLTRQSGRSEKRLTDGLEELHRRFQQLRAEENHFHGRTAEAYTRSLTDAQKMEDELEAAVNKLIRRVHEGRWARAQVLRHVEIASMQRRFDKALARVEEHVSGDAAQLAALYERQRAVVRAAAPLTALFTALLGLLVWFRFQRDVNRPVRNLVETARAVHAGNIRIKADEARAGDLAELSEAFNAMTDRLAEALDDLKSGEERLRRVLEALPMPAAVVAADGNLEFVNGACTDVLGWTVQDVPDLDTVWKRLYPDPAYRDLARRSWNAEVQAARTTGRSMPLRSWKVTSAHGRVLDMEFRTSVLPDRAVVTMTDITERLAGEAERIRLSAILEATTDLVSTAAPDSKMTYLNRAGREMIGWAQNLDITGALISDIHPPHALEVVERLGMPAAVRHGSWRGETSVRHADGHDIPVSQVIIAHKTETGEVSYFSTVIRDISENKRTEIELAKSNAMLTSVIDQAPFGVMVAEGMSEKWALTMINREAERINGVPADEQIGIGVENGRVKGDERLRWRMFRPDGTPWPPTETPISAAMQGSVCRNLEMLVRTPAGRESFILCNSSPIRDRIGAVIAAVVIFSDISEMKRAEMEMVRLRNYLGDILDSMPSIIVGVDRNGRVTQFNRSARLETGLKSEEVLGRDVGELIPRLAELRERIRETVHSGRPFVRTKRKITENGRTRYEDLTIFPLYGTDESGAVIRMDDVTDRARMEEIMIQSEKMMSVGGLAAGMAHEINNPLGIILQGVQSTSRRLAPDLPANRQVADELDLDLRVVHDYLDARNIFQYLDGIRTAGARAAEIVRNMLDFSRRSESLREPCSLSKLIDTVIDLAAGDYDLKKKYDFKQIKVVRQYEPDTPETVCVRTEVEQVVLNLLKNAAQAMKDMPEDHEPVITVRTFAERGKAVIQVRDNGPGMSEEVRKRIFEPFFTTKAPGTGTGLGLAVSYFIISGNHAGEFLVDSAPGKGSTFTIRLPAECRA